MALNTNPTHNDYERMARELEQAAKKLRRAANDDLADELEVLATQMRENQRSFT